MTHVLFHGLEFPPQAGGVGAYMYNMGCALRGVGVGVTVLTSQVPGRPAEEELPCGRVLRGYARGEARHTRVRNWVLAVAREVRADWIEGADHHGEVAPLLAARGRPPVVVKIHGSQPIRVLRNSQALYGWQRGLIRIAMWRQLRQTIAERRVLERADAVLVPSRRMLEELQRQGLRLPARRAVLPNPAPPRPDGYANAEAPRPTLLMVGRLDIGKGISALPGLLASLAPAWPGLRLEIAGEDSYARGLGSLRAWLERRLGAYREQVVFLGKQTGAGLDDAYRRAWVVVLPSRWDNFPTVLLEAMVRAKPVVASPHGGMPEMLDGTPCRAADPEEREFAGAVDRLLRDPAARRAAGAALQRKAETAYAPSKIVRDYLDFMTRAG